jgi:hypothetical protein
MTTTIDTPGLAKAAPGDLLRELTNERARVKRRLDKAKAKLAGIKALKESLQPYLQPGDYEHIYERLEREFERLDARAQGNPQAKIERRIQISCRLVVPARRPSLTGCEVCPVRRR